MSLYRPEDLFEDTTPHAEVADGVLLERRMVLKLSAAAVAAALATLGCGAPASVLARPIAEPVPEPPAGGLDPAGLLAELAPRAERLVAAQGEGEEAYLAEVGALMRRVDPTTREQVRAAMRSHRDERRAAGAELHLGMVLFAFQPGRGFPPHDHRHYIGVIHGLEGSTRIRNWEMVGDELVPPKGATFQVRATRDDLIGPGMQSSLGLRRDNIHEVKAGADGARVLDVFTFYQREGARSVNLTLDDAPRDADAGIWDARWA